MYLRRVWTWRTSRNVFKPPPRHRLSLFACADSRENGLIHLRVAVALVIPIQLLKQPAITRTRTFASRDTICPSSAKCITLDNREGAGKAGRENAPAASRAD